MPLVLETMHAVPADAAHAANCVTVGLINNMPDAALEATERQFVDLIRASARNTVVRLLLFAIPEVPRGEAARRDMAGRYRPLRALWDSRLDGLIVTGTEPRSPDLRDEPYWHSLAKIVDWAKANTRSTIWSCLAAHAAVLHMDGIVRHPLADKCFGIFDCVLSGDHPVTRGLPARLPICHSRWNGLREEELAASGYVILSRSAEAGIDMFVRQHNSLFVLFQGHPEYDPSTLMREYRRDVRRFLRGDRRTYPSIPQNYFHDRMTRRLVEFRLHALANRREALIEVFPDCRDETLQAPWRPSVERLMAQWLGFLGTARSSAVRPSSNNMTCNNSGNKHAAMTRW